MIVSSWTTPIPNPFFLPISTAREVQYPMVIMRGILATKHFRTDSDVIVAEQTQNEEVRFISLVNAAPIIRSND